MERHGYALAVAAVAVATALFYLGRPHFAKGQWGLLYLPIVLVIAALSGVRPALLAALLCFLAWNYVFIPPYGTFIVHDPKDWLMLAVFLVVGLLMGWQTGRLRQREAEALALQSVAVQADALREADRMKSTLVSAVSHELRTPLASLTATITSLLEDDLPWDEARARQELAAIREDLSRLGTSIGSLLDLSRLEASEWRPRLEQYELGEILGTALSHLTPGQRGRVSVSLPDDLPLVRLDFDQWVRVFDHLLGNALLYSGPESPVRVGAGFTPDEVRLWVEDEGPGIPPEERDLVFGKFYRGKAAGLAAGTGIGLAITSEIVRFHGGRIWVEEASPRGARLVITLPREGETEA